MSWGKAIILTLALTQSNCITMLPGEESVLGKLNGEFNELRSSFKMNFREEWEAEPNAMRQGQIRHLAQASCSKAKADLPSRGLQRHRGGSRAQDTRD